MQALLDAAVKYYLNWFFGIIAALIALLYRRVLALKKQSEERQRQEDKQDLAMREAMIALMRDRIFQSCRYHMKNNYINTGDLEVLNALYKSYHDLGGDTIATELVKRVNGLEIRVDNIH